jgi:hypothetical protein
MGARSSTTDLLALCDELVEALYDTIAIALDTDCGGNDWEPHLGYLQELARAARGIAARASDAAERG